MKLLCSVVSLLLQVSEAAAVWGSQSRRARLPWPHIPLGRALYRSQTLSGSPEQLKQSCFPVLCFRREMQREHVSLGLEDRFQRSGQEVGVHTFHPQSSGQVTTHRRVTSVTQVTASGRVDEEFDANVGRVQELSSWKSKSGVGRRSNATGKAF